MDATDSRQIVGERQVDPIRHHRRLGLPIGAEIPDSLIVESARNKDTESARLVCQFSVQRLATVASTEAEKQLLKLLTKFAYSDIAPHLFDNEALPFDISDVLKCIARPKIQSALRTDFSDYISECFRVCAQCMETPVSAAFNLRLAKGEGRSLEIERNFEIAEGVEAIRQELKQGKLRDHVQRFLDGLSTRLPLCIDRHLRVHGYSSHNVSVRRHYLASSISSITSDNRKNVGVAGTIYIECMKVRATVLRDIVDSDSLSTNEKNRFEDQIEILNSYGAMGRGKGNQGIGLSGIKSIYKRYAKKLPGQAADRIRVRSKKESARLLAFENPIVSRAIDIISSPNVGNQDRFELLKLQKQTPKDAQVVWPDLWEEFRQALAKVAEEEKQLSLD